MLMPRKILLKIWLFLAIVLFCNSKIRDWKQNQHQLITIAILGTNDLHGTAFPREILRTDNGETYKYGGLVYMARLIQIIKEEFKDRAIYLDGGDQFQGGIQGGPEVSKGEIVSDFYKAVGLKGSAIGNHEFDFGQEFLKNYLENKGSISLSANMRSQKGEQNFLPNHKGVEMYDLNGIKLGVIGLSTLQTPTSTSGFVQGLFPPYQFLDYADIVIQKSKQLREKGANAVIITSHVGNTCPKNSTYAIRTPQTPQEPCEVDELSKMIDKLPEGTIDGIVSGHRHLHVHHWYKNIPIMGNINGGYYFNAMYLNFDAKTKKVVSSAIEGPIPVCERLFQNTLNCEFQNQTALKNAGQLKNWTFHHRPVYAHQKLSQTYRTKWEPLMEPFFQKIVDTELLLIRVRDAENALGNIISSVLLMVAQEQGIKADYSIINHGAFRSTWYPGTVQYQHFYAMFPFSGRLKSFQLSGAEVIEMIKRVQNGWDGFYQTAGLKQTVSLTSRINDEGVPVLQKGFVNVTLPDGSPIIADKIYTGVTLEFLLKGGDDFIKAFGETDLINPETGSSFVPLVAKNIQDLGEQREQLSKQLQKIGTLRKQEWGLDPQNPRMVVVRK